VLVDDHSAEAGGKAAWSIVAVDRISCCGDAVSRRVTTGHFHSDFFLLKPRTIQLSLFLDSATSNLDSIFQLHPMQLHKFVAQTQPSLAILKSPQQLANACHFSSQPSLPNPFVESCPVRPMPGFPTPASGTKSGRAAFWRATSAPSLLPASDQIACLLPRGETGGLRGCTISMGFRKRVSAKLKGWLWRNSAG
jgi:hypothetical protein